MILQAFLDRAQDVKQDDRRLAVLMSDMERQFDIPKLTVNLPAWKKKTSEADQILAVYRQISRMRS